MANFDKVSNYVNQGLQTAQQAVQLVQNIKSAKSGATTAQTAPATATTAATGTATATAQRQSQGGTSLTLGINKKSLIIGGAILAGVLVVALVARR